MVKAISVKETAPVVVSTDIRDFERMNGGVCGARLVEVKGKRFVMKTEEMMFGLEAIVKEWLAYFVSNALGFEFVPATHFVRDENWRFYSLQEFVDGAVTWSDAEWKNEYSDRLKQVNPKLGTQANLFDYLIHNSDRHSGNCMLDAQSNIKLIDNGLSFRGETYMPSVCYKAYTNSRTSLIEFAARLNRADLTCVEQNIAKREYDAFVQRIRIIGRNAVNDFATFEDSL